MTPRILEGRFVWPVNNWTFIVEFGEFSQDQGNESVTHGHHRVGGFVWSISTIFWQQWFVKVWSFRRNKHKFTQFLDTDVRAAMRLMIDYDNDHFMLTSYEMVKRYRMILGCLV